MYTENFYMLLGTCVVFLLIALYSSRRIASIKDFFHRTGDFDWFLSLSAANVTLGTGVAYYLSSSGRFGWPMLLSPLMVYVGYLAFSTILRLRPALQSASSGNFLKWVDEQAGPTPSIIANVAFLSTISLVLTFLLILAYEIYASSMIFSQLLVKDPTQESIIVIAFVLSSITAIYTLWGGVVAVLKTDRIQIVGVIVVIVSIGYATFLLTQNASSSLKTSSVVYDLNTYWGIAAAVCGAVATQFYSLLNWGAISNFPEGHNPSRTLKLTGILTWLMLSVLVISGIIAGGADASISFKSLVEGPFLTQQGLPSFFLVGGMVCIVLSTADSLMIQIGMFSYDNILQGNSMNDSPNPKGVRNLRLISMFSFALVLAALIVFIATQPDLLFLLFAVAGGIIVYAPFMFMMLWMSNRRELLAKLPGAISVGYFGLFVVAFALHIVALIVAPKVTSIIVTVSFAISSASSLLVYKYLQRGGVI